jgi:hypothetical protein
MSTYPTLASETIVERKGENALDRQASAVLVHPKTDETSPVTAGGEVATGDRSPPPVDTQEAADTDEAKSG